MRCGITPGGRHSSHRRCATHPAALCHNRGPPSSVKTQRRASPAAAAPRAQTHRPSERWGTGTQLVEWTTTVARARGVA
eukprot:5723927-Prymnesium_polylepis.2